METKQHEGKNNKTKRKIEKQMNDWQKRNGKINKIKDK